MLKTARKMMLPDSLPTTYCSGKQRLPVDLTLGLSHDKNSLTKAEYTEKWKIAMKEAYSLAM